MPKWHGNHPMFHDKEWRDKHNTELEAPVETPVETVSTCVHRWRIADTNGSAELPGTCVYCGGERTFNVANTARKMPYGYYKQRAEMAEYERVARNILS